MGKHSDPNPRWFWLSLAAAAGKALLAVLLLGGVAVGATMWLGGGGGADPQPAATTAPGTLAPEETASAESAFETEPEEPEEPEESEEDLATQPAEEATDGGDKTPVRATVQVLNGSGDATALQEVIAALEELGYQVVADARASRAYTRTTVFWSEGFEDDARALRRTDDRFGILEPNERLDPTINLHVVVGRDWVSDR